MAEGIARPDLQLAKPKFPLVSAGIIGLVATPVAWWAIQPFQANVIHYELQYSPGDFVSTVVAFSALAFLGPFILASCAAWPSSKTLRVANLFALAAPMVLLLPLAVYAAWSYYVEAPLRLGFPYDKWLSGFHLILLALAGAGATAYRSGIRLVSNSVPRPILAVVSLVFVIGLLTAVHVAIQLNYYNHFMLGHADIGHFTEELKNALAGRGLRSDSFNNTRLGWHFVPLMFVLVPGYAIWPSITYLMTLGPLVLHLGALPVFWFVRRRTDSVLTAWLCALAWLMLPSLSRLVYSNTYGFAWLYTSVPLLCLLLGAVLLQRWKLCWLLVAVLLLSRETHTAVTLGVGAYLALFTVRRRTGIVIMAVSIGYALLCAEVIIPYFAKAGRYERLDMFGELGASVGALAVSAFAKPDVFFGRLIRPQSINFLLLLLATMFFLPLRGWRLALAALPSLLVHLLLEGTDWISIKFWHHAMVLPILFFAALSLLKRESQAVPDESPFAPTTGISSQRNLGVALALVVCAGWGHYFFGFSPLSKSYDVYARDAFLQNPDPRLDVVRRLRKEIPPDRTILATERLAAHFIEYKRLYTGRRPRLADFIILDRSDQWDTSGLPKRAQEFALNGDYAVFSEQGPIIVFARKLNAPPLNFED